jgi:predicted branched-subunit amino acid permease
MGVGVTDVLAADFLRRFDLSQNNANDAVQPLRYFQWAAVFIWVVWQTMSMAGIMLAHLIPAEWALEFVATLALLAMLLPMVADRPSLVCVLVAGAVSLIFAKLPLNLGLLIAVVAGVGAAMLSLPNDKNKENETEKPQANEVPVKKP